MKILGTLAIIVVAGFWIAIIAKQKLENSVDNSSDPYAPVKVEWYRSLAALREAKPKCKSMTDYCVMCTSTGLPKLECSTPAFACLPAGWRCTD
jgi:hypothetical protein